MLMRILIPFIILSCIVCCRTKELRIPDQPGLSHLASPVFLKSDTTWVDLKDYFLYPEKIKKITPFAGVKLYWDKTASTLGVIAGDSGVLLSGMNIRYEGYDYQIPVMRPNPDAGFYIGTDEVRGDTFFLQSTSPVIDWAVYFQNYKLAENFLSCTEKRVGIVLPEAARQLKYGELRIWARDSFSISNAIIIPLRRGKLITEVGQLNDTDKRTTVIYGLEVKELATPDTGFIADSMNPAYSNIEVAAIGQKMVEGYFKDLGINTLYLFPKASADSLSADLRKLELEARRCRLTVVVTDSLAGLDRFVFDKATAVFARSNTGFEILAQALNATFQDAENDYLGIHYSGNGEAPRFVTRTDEFSLLPVQSERQDTVYRKLVQFLAFNVTIPGIPMIGEGDEIGWPKKEGILGQGEEWTDEQLNVKSKLSALNQLRGEHMALLYGDFICVSFPLHSRNKRIHNSPAGTIRIPLTTQQNAYIRSFFGKNVLVVFNKGKETVSLKLDLPEMKREENFSSLFGNRFSYDNSKIILDVPAYGVEIIYN